jgi:hypothetical protein
VVIDGFGPNFATSFAVVPSSAALSGVHTGPGATQFTRMPRPRRFCASVLVSVWIAPFDAE